MVVVLFTPDPAISIGIGSHGDGDRGLVLYRARRGTIYMQAALLPLSVRLCASQLCTFSPGRCGAKITSTWSCMAGTEGLSPPLSISVLHARNDEGVHITLGPTCTDPRLSARAAQIGPGDGRWRLTSSELAMRRLTLFETSLKWCRSNPQWCKYTLWVLGRKLNVPSRIWSIRQSW